MRLSEAEEKICKRLAHVRAVLSAGAAAANPRGRAPFSPCSFLLHNFRLQVYVVSDAAQAGSARLQRAQGANYECEILVHGKSID